MYTQLLIHLYIVTNVSAKPIGGIKDKKYKLVIYWQVLNSQVTNCTFAPDETGLQPRLILNGIDSYVSPASPGDFGGDKIGRFCKYTVQM